MGILTGKPDFVVAGNISGTITLSLTDLIAGLGLADRWAVEANISTVLFVYEDLGGLSGPKKLGFSAPGFTGRFSADLSAAVDSWVCAAIILRDQDGGSHTIPRSGFGAHTAEFDIDIDAAPSPLPIALVHYDPAKANAGANYADGTAADGTTWHDDVVGANHALLGGGAAGVQWKGSGIVSDPYRLNFPSDTAETLVPSVDIAAPSSYQAFSFWGKIRLSTVGGYGWWMLEPTDWAGQAVLRKASSIDSVVYEKVVGASAYTVLRSAPAFIADLSWHLYTFTRDSAGNIKTFIDENLFDSFTDANLTPMAIHWLFGEPASPGAPIGDIGDIWVYGDSAHVQLTEHLAVFNATKAKYIP